MNVHEVEDFLRLRPLLKSAYEEMSVLSKNNPIQSLNPFKLKLINSILVRANTILEEDDNLKPFSEEFVAFNELEAPNNSDVVFILSSYLASMERMRCENIEKTPEYPNRWYWTTNGKISDDETDPPTMK